MKEEEAWNLLHFHFIFILWKPKQRKQKKAWLSSVPLSDKETPNCRLECSNCSTKEQHLLAMLYWIGFQYVDGIREMSSLILKSCPVIKSLNYLTNRVHALGSDTCSVGILSKTQSTTQTTCSSKGKACTFQWVMKAGLPNDGVRYQNHPEASLRVNLSSASLACCMHGVKKLEWKHYSCPWNSYSVFDLLTNNYSTGEKNIKY